MSYSTLLKNLGFDSDPFAKTNADEEERLEHYFIAPPFFSAVYGTLNTPKSALVFAPRGNGKTALKRKIEIFSKGKEALCITYNSFNITGKKLSDIDQKYHLDNIIRLVVIAIITGVQNGRIDLLTKDDRHLIYLFVKEYLSKIDQTELKTGIVSIKNFNDQAKELWNKFTGPIGLVINALLEKIGLGATEIQRFQVQGGQLGTQIDQLQILFKISKKLGYQSIYILVDKVDENALTAGATSTYKFIAPLISDLQLLELDGYGLKFFLWDLLLDDYRQVARPDRVKYYVLNWETGQLSKMLSERLRAYSENHVSSLTQLMEPKSKFNLDQFVCYFAQGSPRNVIRICKEIFDQQSELNPNSKTLSSAAVKLGFEVIAKNISAEKYKDDVIKDLKKTKRCDFTIRHVYSTVFKFSQQAGLNKVRSWEDSGAVKSIGTIKETKGARTSNHYGIADLLLAKTIFPELSIFDFSNTKLMICSCGEILLRDWDIKQLHVCEYCQKEIDIKKLNSNHYA